MKFYLSSFKLGNKVDKLLEMADGDILTAYIPNALDASADRDKVISEDLQELTAAGLEPEVLDLKDFFDNSDKLLEKIHTYCVLWVAGGNAFVLRQAMKLSGIDKILESMWVSRVSLLYGGYGAGICVLSPTLKGLHLMQSPDDKPYGEVHETIWEGLNLLSYHFAPHYKSDHPQSELVNKTIEYYIENKQLFFALRDGDALIKESQ